MPGDREDPLGSLRWHWGEAYIIARPRPDLWLAERRDTHDTLRAAAPDALADRIRADYLACPVARPVTRRIDGGAASLRRLPGR
jgi:hypothetical protein